MKQPLFHLTPRMIPLNRFAYLCVFLILSSLIINAQDTDLYLPKEPYVEPTPDPFAVPLETQEEKAKSSSSKAFIQVGKIIIYFEESDLAISPSEDKSVEIINNIGFSQESFEQALEPFLGEDITDILLSDITQAIVLLMREQNRPVVDVIIPEQDITAGHLKVLVKISKIGNITVRGNRWFSVEQIIGAFDSTTGDVVDGKKIRDDLNWLNKNPFRRVNLIFSEGLKPWETDIEMEVLDKFPMRFYTGYENNGNSLTGYDRFMAGINTGKFWKWDHRFNYQFTASSDFDTVEGHSFSYVIPFPWKHSLTFFGTYSTSEIEAQGLKIDGESYQLSARYLIMLPSDANYSQQLSAGIDMKQSNSNIDFGVLNLSNVEIAVAQLTLDYEITFQDKLGYSTGMVNFIHNPGGFFSENKDENHQLFSGDPNVTARYLYSKFKINRTTYLPKKWEWFTTADLHYSNKNLLPSEQFSMGGSNSIRGFEQNAVAADIGFKWSNEIRFPSFNTVFKGKALRLDFSVFLDWGVGRNNLFSPEEANEFTLSSYGANLNFFWDKYLSGHISYATPIETRGLGELDKSQDIQMGVILSY